MAKDLKALLEQQMKEDEQRKKLFPGGLPTLMDVPGRRDLPEVDNRNGRPSVLVEIVTLVPELYTDFIMLIRSGAYIHVAAEAIGISETTFRNWINQGGKDMQAEKDTFYSRLVYDVRRAIAQCRADKERKIAETDPKTWLTKGPGKIFGDQWGKKEQVQLEEQPQDAIDSQITQKAIEVEEEQKTSKIEMDVKMQLEAIEALEAAGQGSYSIEFKNSLRKQIGLPALEPTE